MMEIDDVPKTVEEELKV